MKTLVILGVFVVGGFSAYGAGDQQNVVDGTLIRHEGSTYRIVNIPERHEMKVYVSGEKNSLPSELVVKVKKKGKLLDRLHLALDNKEPDHVHYTGVVPANVSISGGIKFDIEFSKTKK